jgi:ABC-type sugar transport system substrate-binding protein
VLNKVAEKSKLITFDSDAPKSKRLLYIGTNNYEAGKVLGAHIVKLLPNGGKIAVFVGTLSADNAAQRLAGVEAALKGHNITIVDKREDNTDRAKARSNVEDIVNARSDLNLVVGLYSYNGPAIASALESLGKKGKVLAAVFDEEDGTLDGVASGVVSATVVQAGTRGADAEGQVVRADRLQVLLLVGAAAADQAAQRLDRVLVRSQRRAHAALLDREVHVLGRHWLAGRALV